MNRVTEIYQKYEKRIELLGADAFTALNFGPAHIVWEDGNMENSHLLWCIEHAKEFQGNLSDAVVEQVCESLRELMSIPEEIRHDLWVGSL